MNPGRFAVNGEATSVFSGAYASMDGPISFNLDIRTKEPRVLVEMPALISGMQIYV
jgi:hypothetical protein